MKKVLVINLGWEQEPLLDLIDSQGLQVFGIHSNSDYYKKPRYRDVLVSDYRDLPRIIKYAEKIQPEAVISDQCDYSHFAQAVIAEKFKLPGPKVAEAQIGCNKFLQRVRSKAAGVLSPDFSLCLGVEDVKTFARKHGFPIIAKPVDNRGSYGVNKIECFSDCENAYYDALVNSHSRYAVVEKFIEGTHITVDGYVFQEKGPYALAIASKKKLLEKNSIIDGEITYPAQISNDAYHKLQETLVKIASKFPFSFGFLHGEFILTDQEEIYLTEIANRGGGVWTSEIIVPNVTGINMNARYLNDCLGEERIPVKLDLSDIKKTPTIMKFFSFQDLQDGVVDSIKGIEALTSLKNVLQLRILLKKGDVVNRISGGGDRHGVIIMTGETHEMLTIDLARAVKTLEVNIKSHENY